MESKKKTKKMYEETYGEFGTSKQDDLSGKKIFGMVGKLVEADKCSSVIDFGSGSCSLIRRLHEKYKIKVTGVDFVKHKDSFNTILHDLDDFPYPFENNSYDVALSIGVLHAMHFPKEFVKECHRILKPNGMFFLTVVNSIPVKSRPGYLFGKLYKVHSCPFHISFFNKATLEKYFKEAGFSDIKFYNVGRISSRLKVLPPSWFSLLFLSAKKKA